jgi:hypothetical protein
MALKPDRISMAEGQRIKFFMTEVAEAGIVVNMDAPGGAGMDNPDATVSIPVGPSGAPAGVLMNDVVDLNLTRQHLNQHKDEVQVGNKVTILKRGVVRTNALKSGDTPDAGDPAHYTNDGEFTSSVTTSDQVGVFASPVDDEGYVEVEVNFQ